MTDTLITAKLRRRMTPTYGSWRNMLGRCENSLTNGYRHYGGRGITVCERWQDFENFLLDMGKRPEGTTLDRIDNNGNYEPSNCKWSTSSEQSQNRRAVEVIAWNGTVYGEPSRTTPWEKGGKARAASLTPERRKNIASQGGASRWKGMSAEQRKKVMDKVRAKRTYHKMKANRDAE